MSSTRLAALILMALLCLSPACGGNQKQSEQGGQSISESVKKQRQEYEKKAQKELDQLDQQISQLKVQATKRGKRARIEINQQIRDLNHKSEVARQKLRVLDHSSQKAWKDMKVGMDAAIKDLKASYEHAASKFR